MIKSFLEVFVNNVNVSNRVRSVRIERTVEKDNVIEVKIKPEFAINSIDGDVFKKGQKLEVKFENA